jgi:site-specific DNA-methyltransferase (cytosine-N4-specific)
MPESVRDRCTKAHEYIFLLSKSERYYFDGDAIRQPHAPKSLTHRGGGKAAGKTGQQDGLGKVASGNFGNWNKPRVADPRGANRRSVWTVTTKPFKGAHFATFPPDLVLPCVLAGCPSGGTVLDPFNGAGTTGLVALSNGRRYCGIELNPEYAELTKNRLGVFASQVEAA